MAREFDPLLSPTNVQLSRYALPGEIAKNVEKRINDPGDITMSDPLAKYKAQIDSIEPSEEEIQAAMQRFKEKPGSLPTFQREALLAPRGPSPEDKSMQAQIDRAWSVFQGGEEQFNEFVKAAVEEDQPLTGNVKSIKAIKHPLIKPVKDEDVLTPDFIDLMKRVEDTGLHRKERRGKIGVVRPARGPEGGRVLGYGHQMLGKGPKRLEGKEDINRQLRKDIMERGVKAARREVSKYGGDWDKLNLKQRQLLAEAAFNGSLAASPTYLKSILKEDYEKANEILSMRSYRHPRRGTQILQRRIDKIRDWAGWEHLPPYQLRGRR